MNSSNIEAKFGTIGFLAFIYLLFSESIKEDSVPLIIQHELKFETMLTPLFAEFSISFSPLIGSLIAVTLPLVFIILVDQNLTFGPAFAVSSFSFVRNGFPETNDRPRMDEINWKTALKSAPYPRQPINPFRLWDFITFNIFIIKMCQFSDGCFIYIYFIGDYFGDVTLAITSSNCYFTSHCAFPNKTIVI